MRETQFISRKSYKSLKNGFSAEIDRTTKVSMLIWDIADLYPISSVLVALCKGEYWIKIARLNLERVILQHKDVNVTRFPSSTTLLIQRVRKLKKKHGLDTSLKSTLNLNQIRFHLKNFATEYHHTNFCFQKRKLGRMKSKRKNFQKNLGGSK